MPVVTTDGLWSAPLPRRHFSPSAGSSPAGPPRRYDPHPFGGTERPVTTGLPHSLCVMASSEELDILPELKRDDSHDGILSTISCGYVTKGAVFR